MVVNKLCNFINDSTIMPHHRFIHFPLITFVNASFNQVSNWDNAVPVRPHWRLWWNPEPGAEIGCDAGTYALDPGHMVLVPPYVRITHRLHQPVWSLALHVEVNEPVDPGLDRVFYPELPEDMVERLQQLNERIPQGFTFTQDKNHGAWLHLFLGEIFCRALQLLPSEIWSVPARDPRVDDAVATIHSAVDTTLSNTGLARQANLSTNAFIRLFSQNMGVPPQVYMQNVRLDKAARLLQQSDESIDIVAESCGFCDRNYLSKLFKRRFGVGPARYRRQMS
ncbi:hypothetical protein BVX99_01950 [bacterium F16]|nr:hypothetical protein BVX99_01950 [bacterium F16]